MPQTNDTEKGPVGPFRLGEWTVEPALNRLSRGDESTQLEPRLMDLLVFFAQHPGEVLSRETIIDAVWAQDFVGEGVLRRAVASLREALGDDAKNPSYIETISKRGYRLIAEVTRDEPVTSAPVGPGAEGLPARPATRLLGLRPVVWAAGLGAILLVVVVSLLWRAQGDLPPEPPAERKKIVVLPFENLGAPEDADFAAGLSEEIRGSLAKVSDLGVISRVTTVGYDRTGKTVGEIGEDLDVSYVLEGTVRWDRHGEGRGRVRISPQLIRVADDTHLWSEHFERVIEEVFELQSNIARQVIENLQVTLLEPEQQALEARPTDNMDAYDAYLRGLSYGGSDRERAIAMFKRAVELDPDFALAYAYLSVQHSAAYYEVDRTQERRDRAKRAVDLALEFDPDLPMAHMALGFYYERCHLDYEQALEEYNIALKAARNESLVYLGISLVHRRQGRVEQATAGFERAVDLDPLNVELVMGLADHYSFLRQNRKAADVIERAIAIAPGHVGAHVRRFGIYRRRHGYSQQSRQVLEEMPEQAPQIEWMWAEQEYGERNYEAALGWLARSPWQVFEYGERFVPRELSECRCHALLGDSDRVREACDQARLTLEEAARERPEDARVQGSLGLTYAFLGRKEEAIRAGERAVELLPISRNAINGPVYVINLAAIYAWVGEHDAALDRIEYILSIPYYDTVAMLRSHPDWDPLRGHPRFAEILEKYGTEQ